MGYLYVKKSARTRHRLSAQTKSRLALGLLALGIAFFASAVGPMINFQLEYAGKFSQLLSPLSSRFYNQTQAVLGATTTDYTQLDNWFSGQAAQTDSLLSSVAPTSYTLTIPNLKITNAVVKAGSMDLTKSLVQYPQTAMPGQLGNTVIFGHSVLPQFFNPKSYLTIFSLLYKLKLGDDIIINYDNVTYKYKVSDMYEVEPTDLSVLEQRYDGRYLTLITCSPPGTWLRRLIINTTLSN